MERICLPNIDAAIGLFHHRSITATADSNSSLHVSFGADPRATSRCSPFCYDPNPSGTVVDFVSSVTGDSITICHTTGDSYFLTTIMIRIGIYLCDICLTRTSRKQNGCGD